MPIGRMRGSRVLCYQKWTVDDIREALKAAGYTDCDKNVEKLLARGIATTIDAVSSMFAIKAVDDFIKDFEGLEKEADLVGKNQR